MPIKCGATPIYRQVLSDAWKLTLTHKHLWIFGFFATFVGYGGASEIILGAYNRLTDFLPMIGNSGETPLLLLPGFATLRAMVSLSPYPVLSITLFSLTVLLLFTVFAWIISASIGALVASVRKIERGGTPTFSEGLKAGSANVVRVFTMIAGSKLAIGLIFLLTSANLIHFLSDNTFVSLFFFLASFVLFTMLAVAISMLSIFATNATVIESLPTIPSIADGLRVLRKNWLVSVEMVIVLIFVNVGLGFLALLVTMVLSVPLVFLFFVAAIIKSATLMAVIMTVTLIVLVAILVVAGSFLTTFQAAAWSLLWIRLCGHGAHHPKIIRLANWFQQKLLG